MFYADGSSTLFESSNTIMSLYFSFFSATMAKEITDMDEMQLASNKRSAFQFDVDRQVDIMSAEDGRSVVSPDLSRSFMRYFAVSDGKLSSDVPDVNTDDEWNRVYDIDYADFPNYFPDVTPAKDVEDDATVVDGRVNNTEEDSINFNLPGIFGDLNQFSKNKFYRRKRSAATRRFNRYKSLYNSIQRLRAFRAANRYQRRGSFLDPVGSGLIGK